MQCGKLPTSPAELWSLGYGSGAPSELQTALPSSTSLFSGPTLVSRTNGVLHQEPEGMGSWETNGWDMALTQTWHIALLLSLCLGSLPQEAISSHHRILLSQWVGRNPFSFLGSSDTAQSCTQAC